MNTRLLLMSLLVLPIIAGCTASGSAPRAGEPAHGSQSWNEMDGEQMQALRATGDAARGAVAFEICSGCHRDGGAGRVNGSYPRLAGQHAAVLIKQMVDIRAGRRTNHKMQPFISEELVGPQQMADIAAYLEAQPVRPDNGTGPGSDLEAGQELYGRDCAACHGPSGEGDAGRFYPRLSGQHYLYLLRQIGAIHGGERGNSNPDMARAIEAYTEAELAAVSDYVSRLTRD